MLLSIKIQDLVLKPELNTDVSQNLGSSLADSQPNLKVAVNAEFFKAQTINGSFDTKTELGTVTQTRDNTDGSIKFYTGMALANGEPMRQAILIGSIPKGEPMEPARTGIIQNAVASKTAGLTAGSNSPVSQEKTNGAIALAKGEDFKRYPQIAPALLNELTQTNGWRFIGSLNMKVKGVSTDINIYRGTANGKDIYAVNKPDTKDAFLPMASVAAGTAYSPISDRVTDLVRGQFNNPIRVGDRATPRVNSIRDISFPTPGLQGASPESIRRGHNGGSLEPSTWTNKERVAFLLWMGLTKPFEKSIGSTGAIADAVMVDPVLRESVVKQYLTNPHAALRDIPGVAKAIQHTPNLINDVVDFFSLAGLSRGRGSPGSLPVGPTLLGPRQGPKLPPVQGPKLPPGVKGIKIRAKNLANDVVVEPFRATREAATRDGLTPLQNLRSGTVGTVKQAVGAGKNTYLAGKRVGATTVAAWNVLRNNPKAAVGVGIQTAFDLGKAAGKNLLNPANPFALQIPTLVKNFPLPAPLKPGASDQEKLDHKNLMEQREVRLTVALSAVLLRYFMVPTNIDTPGMLAQKTIGATGGAISAVMFGGKDLKPSDVLLYMVMGSFSAKNVSVQIVELGKRAAVERQAFRFGVPAFDAMLANSQIATMNPLLNPVRLTDIAQVTLSRMVASPGFNILSQEVTALKNKGHVVVPNASQALASATSGGIRSAGYAKAVAADPILYNKVAPYVLPMLLSVISTAVIKNMLGKDKKAEILTPAELKKVEAATIKYITENRTEVDLIVKNISIALVAAAAAPKTKN